MILFPIFIFVLLFYLGNQSRKNNYGYNYLIFRLGFKVKQSSLHGARIVWK